MSSVNFNAVDEMLHDLFIHLVAERQIILEDGTHSFSIKVARVEEKIKLLVKEDLRTQIFRKLQVEDLFQSHLIMLISQAEVLQELMRQLQKLLESRILLVVWHLQKIENYRVDADVP